jgi:hypothetical protein
MAVSIYRYRKPELTATLTDGGSLLANTTYYLTGIYNKSWVYNGVFSPFADVVSFTTDSTKKSISIYWKTTVPIQGFEDAGGGKIRVKASSHCLIIGNTLIIESGVYAGTYTVNTWENYHSFLIVGTYSTDYTTTFRVETMHNAMANIVIYLSTTAPFSGDPLADTWQGNISNFSHYIWEAGYTTNNIAVSAEFTKLFYGTHPQIEMSVSPPPPWSAVLTKGKIWIDCIGTVTVGEIKQALIDADALDVSYIQGNTFFLYGILRSFNSLTLTEMTILVYSGMFGGFSTFTQITLDRCSLHLLETGYGSYMLMTATSSNFFYENKTRYSHFSGPVYRYAVGVGNSFVTAAGLGAENMDSPVVNMKITTNSGSSWRLAGNLSQMKYTNIEIQNGILYLYYLSASSYPQNRLIDGLTIRNTLIYDFSIQYGSTRPVFDITNCNTSRVNNRKVCYTSYQFQLYTHITDIYFWRKKTLTVLDENGLPIPGATVNLKDEAGTEYPYTTDVNGQIIFEVLEQKSLRGTTGYYFTEVYLDNWTLTVSKSGYENYKSKTVYAYLLETEIALKEAKPIRYFSGGDIAVASSPENGSDAILERM